MALLVYVDDVLLMTGTDETIIYKACAFFDHTFYVKDHGHARYFLGIELPRSSHGLYLTQHKYIVDIIYDVGLVGAFSTSTPIPKGLTSLVVFST